MNQDGNRLLTGVATVAIALVAVATLYARSSSANVASSASSSSTGRIALAGYRPEASAAAQAALQTRVRDYQSEVAAALARQPANPSIPTANEDDEDDPFDLDALDDAAPSAITAPPPAEIPNPTDFAAQENPIPMAYTTEGPIGDSTPRATIAPQTASTNSESSDDYGQSGTMSDSDVYRLVVNNLSDDQRQDFTRAYAAMSAEQRANLLDGFRQQIQGGN